MAKKFRDISGIIAAIVLTLAVISCSAGKSVSEYQPYLSNDIAKSRSTDLKVKIPAGWFTALDNENNLIDLWLIKEDHTAILSFVLINPDDASVKEAGGDLLEASVKYSKMFKKASANYTVEFAGGDDYISIGSYRIGIYKYQNKAGAIVRVALFKYKDKVYELTAIPAPKTGAKLSSPEELFLIQDAVISSIE